MYTEAPATKMLDVRCLACGRSLLDAASIEAGLGPVCRKRVGLGALDEESRSIANHLVYEMASTNPTPQRVAEVANQLQGIGASRLAALVATKALKPAVEVHRADGVLVVKTRWNPRFTSAFKASFDYGAERHMVRENGKFAGWEIPETIGGRLLCLLKEHFEGEILTSDKGLSVL